MLKRLHQNMKVANQRIFCFIEEKIWTLKNYNWKFLNILQKAFNKKIKSLDNKDQSINLKNNISY